MICTFLYRRLPGTPFVVTPSVTTRHEFRKSLLVSCCKHFHRVGMGHGIDVRAFCPMLSPSLNGQNLWRRNLRLPTCCVGYPVTFLSRVDHEKMKKYL